MTPPLGFSPLGAPLPAHLMTLAQCAPHGAPSREYCGGNGVPKNGYTLSLREKCVVPSYIFPSLFLRRTATADRPGALSQGGSFVRRPRSPDALPCAQSPPRARTASPSPSAWRARPSAGHRPPRIDLQLTGDSPVTCMERKFAARPTTRTTTPGGRSS